MVVSLTVGSALLAVGLLLVATRLAFLARCTSSVGEIIRLERVWGGSSGGHVGPPPPCEQVVPVVRCVAAGDCATIVRMRTTLPDRRHRVGSRVKFAYVPSDPQHVVVLDNAYWILPAVCIAVGLVCFVSALIAA